MPSNATLVRTTEFGARPLGVRGEPLHNTHAQIRDVVRRRLGDRHFHLLAEPQAYPATGRIDWYADGERNSDADANQDAGGNGRADRYAVGWQFGGASVFARSNEQRGGEHPTGRQQPGPIRLRRVPRADGG
jgi:hypothetical protein